LPDAPPNIIGNDGVTLVVARRTGDPDRTMRGTRPGEGHKRAKQPDADAAETGSGQA
jgi:hypothetical protein